MNDIYFFDAWTQIGPRPGTCPGEAWRLGDLLEEMAYCSISGALVASAQSVLYDTEVANRELTDLLTPYPQLFPIWNIVPARNGGRKFPVALERELREQAVKAVALHPRTNEWDWTDSLSSDVLDFLSDRQVLSILPRGEVESLRGIGEFLAARPLLPVLLAGAVPEEMARLADMMEAHSNFHVAFVGPQPCGWIEHLCKRGLTERLLFASGAPSMAIGAHRTVIDYAGIDAVDRQKIAGGNLVALLEGQQPDRISTNRSEDALMRAARRAEPLPTALIDLDARLVPAGRASGRSCSELDRADAAFYFAVHSRIGCRGGAIASWRGTLGMDASGGNDAIRLILNDAPPGYWGAATIDPVHYAQDEAARLMSSVYHDDRFLALRPNLRLGLPLTDPLYEVWWRFGDRHRFVALVEAGSDVIDELPQLAERFPRLRWVVFPVENILEAGDVSRLVEGCGSLRLGADFPVFRSGQMERLVEKISAERIVFAGGAPRLDPRQGLGAIVFSRLPLETKQRILGANARELLDPFRCRLPREIFC